MITRISAAFCLAITAVQTIPRSNACEQGLVERHYAVPRGMFSARQIGETLMSEGMTFPKRASATIVTDKGSKFDRLVLYNTESNHDLARAILHLKIGRREFVRMAAEKELELVGFLAENFPDPRVWGDEWAKDGWIKELDFDDPAAGLLNRRGFEPSPILSELFHEWLHAFVDVFSARGMLREGAGAPPGESPHDRIRRLLKLTDQFRTENPKSDLARRYSAAEEAVKRELSEHRQRLVTQLGALERLHETLDTIPPPPEAEPPNGGDPFATE